ncbi:MAG: L-threonylcarbamoyladenylate synthase [Burkholderiales bacterium]
MNGEYKENILKATEVIKSGGLVAFPTETVYGLGANALDEDAVKRIFELKGRPQDNPLIVHVDSTIAARQIAQFNDKAEKLAAEYWPGPLTMVLPGIGIPRAVSAGLDTVGVRMPDSDAALSLISASGVPIAAPSANKSGSPSPTSAEHVRSDFGDDLLILDAGECSIGVESTVVDMTKEVPVILRPGAVTLDMIKECLGEAQSASATFEGDGPPPAPGMKYRHYAPKALVTVVEGSGTSVQEAVKYLYDKDVKKGDRPLVMASRENRKYYGKREVVITGSIDDPREAARNLYSLLREADEKSYTAIYFEAIPKTGIGFAVMNRIYKAAAYNIVKV